MTNRTVMAEVVRRLAPPVAILAGGWLLFLIYSYPGFMSTDSVTQLFQARGIEPRSDWHPPIMAVIWRCFDRLIAGPLPMLVLQSLLFLGGLYGVFQKITTKSRAALLSIAVLLFPPVLTTMAVIWKDSLMAGTALAGTAALLSPRRRLQVAGLALLTLAAALRANGPAAVVPIVIILLPVPHLRGWRRHAVAACVSIAMVLAGSLVNSALVQQKQHPWHNSLALFDITGVIGHVRVPDDEMLAHLEPAHPRYRTDLRDHARDTYNPRAHADASVGDRALFPLPKTEAERAAIEHVWLTLVVTYPRAYAYHRWLVFREVIGYSDRELFGSVYTSFTENEAQAYMLHHHPHRSRMQGTWNDAVHDIESSWVFRPYLYIVIGLALLFLMRGVPPPALALLVSGLVYELSLVVAAPSADYRYSHWMIVCVIVSAVLVFIERLKRGQREIVSAAT